MKNVMRVEYSIRNMCMLAMFMAITLVLSYVNEVIPSLPQGGMISVDVIAIMLCGYLMGAGYGVICGVGVALLQFVLGIAQYYGPWSVLLDYVLPLAVCGLTPLIKTQKIGHISICWGVVFAMFLKYLSHFASGAFLFASYAPEGMNPIVYSLGYNAIYVAPTLILCMIVVPLLYSRLKNAFH